MELRSDRGRRLAFVWFICCLIWVSTSTAAIAVQGWALYSAKLDGTDFKKVTPESNRFCGSPDWSPDGQWIAYDTWSTKNQYTDSEVSVISADGKVLKVIGRGAMPSWSPDGQQIVCHTYDSPQTIVVMNVDGTGRETVLNHWGSPRWSPKFQRIATIHSSTRMIHLLDLRTGVERQILRGPYSVNIGFSISPDGSRFCFGDAAGGVAIATLNEQTSETTVEWILKSGQTNTSSWSPDDKRIIFQWGETLESKSQMYIYNVDSKERAERLHWQDPTRHYSSPDWSPDGKSIVFSCVATTDSSD